MFGTNTHISEETLSRVSFVECTQTQYDSCVKSDSTLYFCEDTGVVYKGETKMSYNLLDVYPVGSVYLSRSTESPSSFMGGTWTKLDEGFLFASSGSLESDSFKTDGIAASQHTRYTTPVIAWQRTA